MIKYWKYTKYVIRHKWYVLIESFRLGCLWQGITHDLSKFLPSEFIPYARYFYGTYSDLKKVRIEKDFNKAWLLHQKRNPHHWQYWILKEDSGQMLFLPMHTKCILEMVADWVGAGRAMGASTAKTKYAEVAAWYDKNGHKMQINIYTRKMIHRILANLNTEIAL